MNSEKAISLIAINTHGIPDLFRPETIEAAEARPPARMEAEGFAREDWRSRAARHHRPARRQGP